MNQRRLSSPAGPGPDKSSPGKIGIHFANPPWPSRAYLCLFVCLSGPLSDVWRDPLAEGGLRAGGTPDTIAGGGGREKGCAHSSATTKRRELGGKDKCGADHSFFSK